MTIRHNSVNMMSIKLLLCVSSLVLVLGADDKYTDKYDNINLDEILENKRLFVSYANCVLDKGKCNAEGKELREHIEEALTNGCAKCTETQRKGAKKVIEHAIKNEVEIWRELTAKYDPSGNFRKQYEDEARQNGLDIPKE